jgi:hypothetical protein
LLYALILSILIELNLRPTTYPEQQLNNYLIQLTPEEFIQQTEDYQDYKWTPEDIRYAALTAQTEAQSLGEDGMLSVLSNIYGRFTSPRWCSRSYCSKNIVEEIKRPNQYTGPYIAFKIYGERAYDKIRPTSYLAVYKFILGFRGSCSGDGGYEYYNSVRGGPVQCKIEMGKAGFIEFFSTEAFEQTQQEGVHRNLPSGTTINSPRVSLPIRCGKHCAPRYIHESLPPV